MKTKILTLLFFILAVPIAHAADLTVTPAVIDAKGVPRDILNYTVTVVNNTNSVQNVFASVHELTTAGNQPFSDPSDGNRPASLADWLTINHGAMMIQPGASETLPLGLTINPYATAGDYHAVIQFVEGGTRYDAEQHLNGSPQVLLNVSVASDAKEVLQVDSFSAAKYFYSGFPVTFNYTLENTGDVPSTPTGKVFFYDRAGHELDSVDANPGGIAIPPNTKQSFTAQWANGSGLGQYKATLDLTYGANDATLESISLFWVLPWQKLLAIFGGLLLVMVILAIWLHREYEKRHYRRRQFIENLMKRPPTPLTPPRPPGAQSVVDLRVPKKRND